MKTRTLYLLLIPIPFFWALAGFIGLLDDLKNGAMDLRFRIRGEIQSPVKIIYLNLDTKTLNHPLVGERPWHRTFFANAGRAVLDLGNARVVGYDFIFSPKSMSLMVPDENILRSDQAMAAAVQEYPDRVVLAANYTGVMLPYMDRPSRPPLKYLGYENPATNPYPEAPTFPILDYGNGRTFGRIGLITVEEERSGGAVNRWVPLYFEYEGESHIRNILYGKQFAYGVQGLDTTVEARGDELMLLYDGEPVEVFPRTTREQFNHFALEMLLASEGIPDEAVVPFEDRIEIRGPDGDAVLGIPLVDGQLMEINWFGPWQSGADLHLSLIDYLDSIEKMESGDPKLMAEGEAWYRQFEDAIVLVGPTDKQLQDLAPTPFDSEEVPKVGVHGNVLKTLYSGRFIHRAPPWVEYAALVALTVLVSLCGMYSGRHGLFYKIAGIIILASYIGVVFVLFSTEDVVLPLVLPAGSSVSTVFLGLMGKLVLEERQKGRIKGMFGTYVSPELVEQMVESGEEPQLGGREENITAFFSDIQSFSSFSEKLHPKDLVTLMNAYLTEMTEILQEEGGTLDKYIGDAIVAMFGAPIPNDRHALMACRSAVRIQARQAELRERWTQEGDRWPAIVPRMRTRIGLNSGSAVVGNMGSTTRFNYTMMGDTVNLAARSESGAKSYGVYTMVSDETKREVERLGGEFLFRYLDRIIVQGRTQPVSVYELIAFKGESSDDILKGVDLFHEGIEHYLLQRWDKAMTCFRESAKFEANNPRTDKWIQTNPSLVMIARCELMKQHPPDPDWDGVYRMTTK